MVTGLSDAATQHALTVDAKNWIAALKEGRKGLGEEGGIPAGASCNVAPDGSVTVLDTASQRRFILSPVGEEASSGTPAKPTAAKDAAPQSPASSTPQAKDAQPAVSADKAPGAEPTPANKTAAPARSQKRRPATIAYSLDAPAPEAAPSKPLTRRTVAYSPAELNKEMDAPKATQATQPRPTTGARPPAAAQAAGVAAQGHASKSHASKSEDYEILKKRDEDPSEDNPLIYRERAYLMPKGATRQDAEAELRMRLDTLRQALSEAPRGQFINLAAFDHRWKDQPQGPPVVLLQWKDWRGEPSVSFPNETETSRRRRATDERLADAFEALQDLPFLSTPAEGLDFVIRLLADTVPSEANTGCLYDINTDELRFVAVEGPGAEPLQGKAVPLSAGILGASVRAGDHATVIEQASNDARFDPDVDGRPGLESKSLLVRPLIHEGRLLGALQLINRDGRERFSEADANLVGYIGARLAEFLHHATLATARKT